MIESVSPAVAGGDFAVKRVVGETLRVQADIFTDGHDQISAVVRHRRRDAEAWSEVRMDPLVNDAWVGEFELLSAGEHEFTVEAWVDHFATWRRDLQRRADADQDLAAEFLIGALLVQERADAPHGAATADWRAPLRDAARRLRTPGAGQLELALDETLRRQMALADPRRYAQQWPTPIRALVDRERARFSSWYELFPRSLGSDGVGHGTFVDLVAHLDEVAAMGFDVLYLPPIHPIGERMRKGRNNTLEAKPADVGSPWAIGAAAGGHDAIHPALGSVADFRALVEAAAARGIEVALDLALQCSPDHPYVTEHPEWFRHRPDGSIQYAENPPKKYQDIYPFDFECGQWRELWEEILRVVMLWVERGVLIFRVDNPHTKPFAMWEWLISQVKQREPRVLFLAEAFTRPKVMRRLAKVGFTQSYSYFTWRQGAKELREYFTELTTTAQVEYFRPNAWPNTPDILTEQLQQGGRAVFITRAALAATLCANWGIYGPAFELMEHEPIRAGSEEYLNSEKYQLRVWERGRVDSLAPLIAAINRARRENPALQQDRTLLFHDCENSAIICYSKTAGDNVVVVVVNTDPKQTQWSAVTLDLEALGLSEELPYQMHDLLTDAKYRWQGRRNVVGLDPATCPVHIFRVRKHRRTEAEFEYFA